MLIQNCKLWYVFQLGDFIQSEFTLWQCTTASNQNNVKVGQPTPSSILVLHHQVPCTIAFDDALPEQTDASPHEVQNVLCEFKLPPGHHLILNDGPLLQLTSHHIWMFWYIK